jgi:hypothetical protein
MISEQLIVGRWSTCEEVVMLTDPVKKSIDPVDQSRCDDCPPERVCAWDCEQGQGVLEIMMGEALAEQARLMQPVGSEPTQQALYDIYT